MPKLGELFRLFTIVTTLVAAGALLAMAYFAEGLPFGRAYTDGLEMLPAASELHERVVVYEDPKPTHEEIWEGRAIESRLTFNSTRDVAVYAAPGSRERSDLYWARRIDGRWSPQGPIIELNRPEADDVSPCFAADDTLFFASNRSDGEGFDIYAAQFDGIRFDDAFRLSASVNSAFDELDPAYDARTRKLYFVSNRPRQEWKDEGVDFDLFVSKSDVRNPSGFGTGERIRELSSRRNERSPLAHPRGGRIVFSSDRRGSVGGYDLYLSTWSIEKQAYLEPMPFGKGNTELDERDPEFLDGGFRLVFRRAERPVQGGAAGDAEPKTASGSPDDPEQARERILTGIFASPSRELARLPGTITAWDLVTLAALLLLLALMAYLARRWQALDILYKALLISLLIHIIAMFLSRRVELLREIEDLPPMLPAAESFEVAFTAQADPTMSMFGGQLPERDRAPSDEREIERAEMDPNEAEVLEPETLQELQAPTRENEFVAQLPERDNTPLEVATSELQEVETNTPEPPERVDVTAEAFQLSDPTELAARSKARSAQATSSARSGLEAPEETRELASAQSSPSEMSLPERSQSERALPERRTTSTPNRGERRAEEVAVNGPEVSAPVEPRESGPTSAERASELLGSALEVPDRQAGSARSGIPERRAGVTGPRAGEFRASEMMGEAQALRPLTGRRSPRTSERVSQRPERRSTPVPQRGVPGEAPVRSDTAELLAGSPKATPTESAEKSDLLGGLGGATPIHSSRGRRSTELSKSAVGGPAGERVAKTDSLLTPPLKLGGRRSGARSSVPKRSTAEPGPRTERTPLTAPSEAVRGPTMPNRSSSASSATEATPRDLLADLGPRQLGRRGPRSRGQDPRVAGGRSEVGGMALPELDAPEINRRATTLAKAMEPRRGKVGSIKRAIPERFSRRTDRTLKDKALREGGGSAATERAVAAGLRYLASKQRSSGYWGDASRPHEKYGYTLYGKTGLAVLAYLGAGHTPQSGTEYSPVVSKAMRFLLRSQDRTGHFGNSSAYGHAIVTYALCEAYAMEKDPEMRDTLQTAIDWILSNQKRRNPASREFGGWSYYYPDGRTFDPYARTSITAWQVMALESARIGGLDVPPAAITAAKTFLKKAFDARRSTFRYSHDPARLRSIYPTLPGSTPAALFVLRLSGESVDTPLYRSAWRFISERRPLDYQRHSDLEFVNQAAGNLYFWYYGTLALFQRGGNDWNVWNTALKRALLPAQEQDGSWRPISPYAETAGDTYRDRIYTTAMSVLMLEVYYRYFTPLLKQR